MGIDDPNFEENPPTTSSPVHRHVESGFHITHNEAASSSRTSANRIGIMHGDTDARADPIPSLYRSHPRLVGNMTRTHQSGDRIMRGANNFQSLQTDGTENGSFIRQNANQCIGGNTPDAYQSHDSGDSVIGNNPMTLPRIHVCGDSTQCIDIHRPQTSGNFASLGGNTPVAYQSHDCGSSVVGNNVIGGNTTFGSRVSSHPGGISNHNGRALASQSTVFSAPQYDGRFLNLNHNFGYPTWPNNDGRFMPGANPMANSSPFNIIRPPPIGAQHYFPMPNILRGNRGATYVSAYPYGGFYPGRTSGRSSIIQAGFPDNQRARLSMAASTSNPVMWIPNESNFAQRERDYLNTIRNIPTQFPIATAATAPIRNIPTRLPTATAAIAPSTTWKDRSGTRVRAPRGLSQTSNVRPSGRKRGFQPDSTTPQFSRLNTNFQPSFSPDSTFLNHTSPIAHISSQGPSKNRNLVGQVCPICKLDLAYKPIGASLSPTLNLPVVAFLPCGHTVHDECLKVFTPEEKSSDPPCIACFLRE